jgi:hypothetical protein
MADREGNVLKVPGFSQAAKVGGEEILASYTRDNIIQKGCQLKAGIGLLEAGTVLALDSGKQYTRYAGTSDEVQTVTITGDPTGGTFTLTYSGQTTAAIDFDATAQEVEDALVALSNIGAGDVDVTGEAGGPYTVTFGGALADTNVAQMTADGGNLTGGTTPDVAVATATAGGVAAANPAVGILRNSVDVGAAGALADVVLGGIVKRDKIIGLDAAAIATLNGRVDPIHNYFIF